MLRFGPDPFLCCLSVPFVVFVLFFSEVPARGKNNTYSTLTKRSINIELDAKLTFSLGSNIKKQGLRPGVNRAALAPRAKKLGTID